MNDKINLSKDSKFGSSSKENFMKYLKRIQNHLPLKITYWDYFKAFFFFIRRNFSHNSLNKYKQIKTGKRAIKEKLDLGYLLKKFYEIDKLKMIIFNETQSHIFDYLPKPMILKNF